MATFDPTASEFPAERLADLLEELTALGVAAARAILDDRTDRRARIKSDGSPVTPADEAAETIIRTGLGRLAPSLPVVSEEQAEPRRPAGANYFLVDPLDGTREFIAGRDEYTVNVSLIAARMPVLGVIVAPALRLVWRGIIDRGAERLTFSAAGEISPPQPIAARARPADELIVMVSRSHLDAATQHYVDGLPHAHRIACGSSIKFCRLAEGQADHYPRLGPTHDWDVAAGHAVLVAAGGRVAGRDRQALTYGTPELRIPAFMAWGAPPAN